MLHFKYELINNRTTRKIVQFDEADRNFNSLPK